MARLKQIKPQIATLALAVPMLARREATPVVVAQDGYDGLFRKTARWQRLRWSVLVRDEFTCQWPGCGAMPASAELVADHIVPARIDAALIWDAANLRCLCKACHDGPRQAQEVAIWGPVARWQR